MARDPQKIKKAYDEDRSVAYKLPDHILKDLDEDQIKDLSAVYNMMSADEKKEFGKGTGDLMDLARQMSDPLQEKYNTGGLDSWTGKPKENSNAMQGPMSMPSAKKPKEEEEEKEEEKEEKIPEGLEALLKDIKSEVGGDTPKKSGALAVAPKPDKVKEETLVDEEIDPKILKLLGIEDTTGLDYSDYKSLLKEKMAADRMGGNKGDSGDAELLTNEYKRIKGSTGKFKVKSQKIKAQSFVAKTKPSSSVKKVTPLLPSVTPQETEQPIQPERQGMDKTLALIASKLNSVDKNVQQTTSNLQNKDAAESKQKNQDRLTAENTAAQRKEERIERTAVLGGGFAGMKKTVKPLTDMMSGLFDFFKRLGFAMFIMELMKFLKDPAKYINGITKWINLQIAKLEMKIENFVVDQIIKPTNDMIKGLNTKLKEFVDGINPFIEKFKKLPGMGNIPNLPTPQVPIIEESIIRDKVFLGRLPEVGDDFMKFDKAPPAPELPASGTTQPGDGTRVQPQETLMGQQPSQSGNGLTPQQKAFAETVSYAEGTSGSAGYNTWFGGSQYGGDLSKKTINEVVALQKKFLAEGKGKFDGGRQQSAAVGKYQMTYPETYAKAAGLNPAVDKFTPENQDKLFLYGYIMKQAGVTEAEINAPEMSDQTIDKLAPVFASFPNLFGPDKFGQHGTNTSYYGQGGKSKEQIKEVYKKQRKKIPTQTTKPVSSPTSPQPSSTSQTKMFQNSGMPALAPIQSSVPNITPPVQKASLTTIGGLSGGDVPGTALAAAGGIQSQAYSFSATNGADLSVLSTKETLRVVGT